MNKIKMDKGDENPLGLSTNEALERLYSDIDIVLEQYKKSHKIKKTKSYIYDAFHHNSVNSTLCWTSICGIVVCAICLLIAFAGHREVASSSLVYEAFVLLCVCGLCAFLVLSDNKLRHNEIPRRVQIILDEIKRAAANEKWIPDNYPHLCSPYSPCITLQWTYRDGVLVNLPWALLVKDDVVVIRPGQVSPGYCGALEKNCEYPILHPKEVYGPSLKNANESISVPKVRKPLENKKYRIVETPYISNLKMALDQALDKPATQLEQRRHLVMVRCFEQIALPMLLLLVLLVNALRYLYLSSFIGSASFLEMFILVPISVILPLLPIIFPAIWMILNQIGNARLRAIFDYSFAIASENDPFDDADLSTLNRFLPQYTWRDIWNNFVLIFCGTGHIMTRSANILHVFGSLTALCCVDKKGILSWPNPTAEKVFFLHNTEEDSQSSSLENVGDINTDTDSLEHRTISASGAAVTHNKYNDSSPMSVAEVLDLTHDHKDPFKLHFDDQEWNKHMTSLKPLGLAILLNTCNLETQEHYLKFCSHVTCEAMYNEHLVPVTNRRCLCELAKQIGFSEQAQKIFKLEQQLATFRHLQPEMVRRDNKFARSLQLSTKLKFPFPHMMAVVIKELSSGAHQLLSQGTADMVLDSCVDFWDGRDLCVLTASDRKKIQDFYQRTSLTSYCTAFSYRPLSGNVSEKLSQVYLELPSDSKQLFKTRRSPMPFHWDNKVVIEPRFKGPLAQFFSTDSLLYNNDSASTETSNPDNCFDVQCNQVFIGMVTMQYQAQADMVHLIEQLERACIRFVHFSKENELRSRVFSEKMGLESGWNCHISLLSERTSNLEQSRAISFSAPSAINLEHSTVKFDPSVEQPTSYDSGEGYDLVTSEDSMLMQGGGTRTEAGSSPTHEHWQSLSCLTDSTEQSAPVNFDMSNRAKLPRGIDKIRPHIEQIDNVPLLVSLFTDCTATVIREMLQIMQDFGEVVCVMLSSANADNMGICMQADTSIAVEPLYPQVCQKLPAFNTCKTSPSPIELSRALNSVSCPLSVRREDPFSIYHLVMYARHYTQTLWSCTQFWLCCCATLTLLQVLALLFMLPPILRTSHVLWLCFVIIPALSVSLMAIPSDPTIMKAPLGKNQSVLNVEIFMFVLWCYGAKFLPAVFTVLIIYSASLTSFCYDICVVSNCTCAMYFLPDLNHQTSWGGWSYHSYTLLSAQQLALLLIVIHFITISMSFINRQKSIWEQGPQNNLLWICTVVILLTLHAIYAALSLLLEYKNSQLGFEGLSYVVFIFACVSPLISFAVTEFIKTKEIKVNVRYQRRARLDFGTKLGMNSPF